MDKKQDLERDFKLQEARKKVIDAVRDLDASPEQILKLKDDAYRKWQDTQA